MKFSAGGDERGGPGQPVRGFQGGRGVQQAAVDDPVYTARSEPTGDDHRGNHKQHAGVDDPAVVALGFKVADRRFGRVADVFAEQAVNQRDQAEDHQHAHPPQLLHACGDGKGAGEQGRRQRHDAEPPQVAFAVGPDMRGCQSLVHGSLRTHSVGNEADDRYTER